MTSTEYPSALATATDPGTEALAHPARGGSVDGASELVAQLLARPAGQVSASTYETARLVSLAPWLAGHAQRVRWLLDCQHADGGWGPGDGYQLVPTLSATEALLAVLRTRTVSGLDEVARAAGRGLTALSGWLGAATPLPDTPALDLIVPALVEAVNEHLDRHGHPPTGRSAGRLGLPVGMTGARLAAVRHQAVAGRSLDVKLHHALEVLGPLARAARGVTPQPNGAVGASPAATAAWLGGPDRPDGQPAPVSYLERVVAGGDRLAPCTTPITVFERSWVVSTLARAGMPVAASPDLVGSLTADLTEAGTATSPGLPPDADTTSVTLYALLRLGVPVDPDCLWRYDIGTGFCTWPGEDGISVTTNAHVLDVLGEYLAGGAAVPGPAADRYRSAVHRLEGLLLDQQHDDGTWHDRWHASPYYATLCCALALAGYGRTPAVAPALARAARWVLATQRPDGSWGRWHGTPEETAYALHLLAVAGGEPARAALGRGRAHLLRVADQPGDAQLWHDKDLYQPTMIVRSAVLAADHLTAGDTALTRR
ncbi:prenyltransferase [Micromonospora sp. WMMA1923]|uniref:prenyltransferase n=1 Tax=Micromonospora sp. WMMA1923 TaxID=3404125 RepID=UPI003B924FE0